MKSTHLLCEIDFTFAIDLIGFGEASPEGQAAAAMHNFFTYVAVKIVCSQLEVCAFPLRIMCNKT